MCDPILVTLLKMRPHPAAHPHSPITRNYPPPPGGSFDKSSLVLFKGSKVEIAFGNDAWVAECRKYIRITGLHENLSRGDGFEER